MTGCLIVLEGPEGSGKSSQLRRAGDWLATRHVVCRTREPGGTDVAEAVRRVVLDPGYVDREPSTDALLMSTARRDLCLRVIRPALERGEIVLSDRFAASTRAYQGGGDGVPDRWLRELEMLATGGLEPDRYVLLDVDVEVGLARRYGDGETNAIDRRDVAFHRRVRERYVDLAREDPDRWRTVDAGGIEDDVWEQVKGVLTSTLRERGIEPPT